MEFQWPWLAKKESQKKEEKKPVEQLVKPKSEREESGSRIPTTDFFSKKSSEKSDSKKLASPERKSQSKATDMPQANGVAPLAGQAEMAKLQADIQQIAEQTKSIEAQSQMDRLRIQKIAEQAKIQQQLMQSLQVPKITPTNKVANPEEVLRATKVRLIAEEVKQTQEALRSIQTANQAVSTTRAPQIQKLPKRVQT
ncbi:MAG: hypothetical protein HY582_01835 [Candidatus Omnitrophica bacterium]|nr:hypothetical protein [Candidatus Omnitrophota bacterium]